MSRISFVDDLLEFSKSQGDANERSTASEIFEKKTRSKFKVVKCKVIEKCRKTAGVDMTLNGEVMEKVKDHVYLGTIISRNGERTTEMNNRIRQSNSVANEIEQICKLTELSTIR